MDFIVTLLNSTFAYSIGMTILHSLWQGALLVIGMNVFLKYHHNERPMFRYHVGYLTVLLMMFSTLTTFAYFFFGSHQMVSEVTNSPGQLNPGYIIANVATQISGGTSFQSQFSQLIPLISILWLVGVVFFSLRLAVGFTYLSKVKRSFLPTVPEWLILKLSELCKEYDINTKIKLRISSKVLSPMVMGFFRPIIVFPVSTINHLSPQETEMILRHELGHIIRNDFLHNIILRISEVIMFYHPGLWWTTRLIERERENHCDEYVIGHKFDRVAYAKTLVKIKEIEAFQGYSVALAFSDNKKSLLERITRILNKKQKMSIMKSNLIVLAVLISSVICISAGTMYFDFNTDEKTDPIETLEIKELEAKSAVKNRSWLFSAQDTSKEELTEMIKAKEKELKIKEKEVKEKAIKLRKEMKEMKSELKKLKRKNGDTSYSFHIDSDDWSEEEREAFAERMEELGERLAEKFDNEEWAEKWENWGERFSERFESEEFGERMEELGERLAEKFEDEEWAEKWENWGERFSEKFESEEFEERMSEMGERLAEAFQDAEFHESVAELAEAGSVFGVEVAENTMRALRRAFDSEDFHFEGDITIDDGSWEEFGKGIGSMVEEIIENTNEIIEDIDFDDVDIHIRNDGSNLGDELEEELRQDGFYSKDKVNLELKNGILKINGKRPSADVEMKYKEMINDAFNIDKYDQSEVNYKFSDKKGKRKNSFSIERTNSDNKRI